VKLNPFIVVLNYCELLIQDKVYVSASAPDNEPYPQEFQPFLHVKVNQPPAEAPVRLLVKFKVRKLNIWQRCLLPKLSIPFFAGAPGFMEKVFLLNECENTFSGFYTWRSREDAECYIGSYPGERMAKNALPDTLSIKIMPFHAY
jgi:hypothetical protein